LRHSSVSVTSGDSLTIASGSASTVPPDEPGKFICLGPQCDAAFPSSKELEAHIREMHTHTCNWAGCTGGSFATKEGLVAHVKSEHLLLCPVQGCTDSFASRKLLGAHFAVKHPDKKGDHVAGKRNADGEGGQIQRVEV
jgi:DNA polymerase epsilon subunit 1